MPMISTVGGSGAGGRDMLDFDGLAVEKGMKRTTAKTSSSVYTETIIRVATGKTVATRVTTKNSTTQYTEVVTIYEEDGATVRDTLTTVTSKSGTTYTEVMS